MRELSGVSLIKPLILFMKVPSLLPNHCPNAPSPNTVTLVIRFQSMNFGGPQAFSLQQNWLFILMPYLKGKNISVKELRELYTYTGRKY